MGRTTHHEGGAGGLGEGAEQVGAHAGNVTDVVSDVVGNDGGVAGVVLRNVLSVTKAISPERPQLHRMQTCAAVTMQGRVEIVTTQLFES